MNHGPRRYRDLNDDESQGGQARGRALLKALKALSPNGELTPEALHINEMVGQHIDYFFRIGREIGYELGHTHGQMKGTK